MQHDRFKLAHTWRSNATHDLDLAKAIFGQFPSRACFHAQQAAQMSLKGALVALSDDHPRTHVADELLTELKALGVAVPDHVVSSANALDLYYVSSRYPDALAGADPTVVISCDDARIAIRRAESVLEFSRGLISTESASEA